ncbi:MAG: hypothetical protein M1442_00820 [Candidatus Thermoplasmatota archaeon]|jgi:hypothetical protein|nr:hypothetical protein [Candidatus Thermoplasmatota archaeon]
MPTQKSDDKNLDSLWGSRDPSDVIKFYSHFSNRDELIAWMRNRPTGRQRIYEVEGDKEVIVVIITADYNNKFSVACREQIFNGLHMIFVESGYGDVLFNAGRNSNFGMSKAIQYNPKWIISSSDDMFKIDDIAVLVSELKKLDHNRIKCVFTYPPGYYHSKPGFVGRPNILYRILMNLTGRKRRQIYKLFRKFSGVSYRPLQYDVFLNRLLYKRIAEAVFTIDFAILSGAFVKEKGGNIFDETYVNGEEDSDLSITLTRNKEDYAFVKYRIGDFIGSTSGIGFDRYLRSVATISYFSYKIEKGLLLL